MSKRENFFSINVVLVVFLILWGVVLMCAEAAHAAQKGVKPPVNCLSKSLAAEKSGIPGMSVGMPDMVG